MNNNQFSLEQYDEAADAIRKRTSQQPTVGMVLGSGLGPLAEQIENADIIPYQEIPHFPVSTVHGHAGRLVIGKLSGVTVCAMQGRFHFYEGYTMQEVTLPVRVMQRMGIRTLILTNAAGGINPSFRVSDLMLMEDHINFVGMTGTNPLVGPNLEAFGTRFPAMNQVYTKRLRQLANQAASNVGLHLQHGTYFALSGPTFESPAEIRMIRLLGADAVGMSTGDGLAPEAMDRTATAIAALAEEARRLGADAVGMSTAPEAIVAHHAGMEVLAISTITNMCISELDSTNAPSHEEVNEAGKLIVPKLRALMLETLRLL